MGFFDGLRNAARLSRTPSHPTVTAPRGVGGDVSLGISPWSDQSALGKAIVASDLIPEGANRTMTRAHAMTVPAVVKGRARLVEKIATAPLRLIAHSNGIDTEQPAPAWFHETGLPGTAPVNRMTDTLDDLVFHGVSAWIFERDADATGARTGTIHSAAHLPHSLWQVEQTRNVVQVRDDETTGEWRDAAYGEVALIRGPQEGLLTLAQDTIRGALDIERTWRGRARSPIPTIILEDTDEYANRTDDEKKELVAEVAKARLSESGAVMYAPAGIRIRIEGQVQTDLLTGGRNAAALDIAGFLNLNASSVDATVDKSSLNYETKEGTERTLVDRVDYWTSPIEQRLSLDDITPPGTRIRFDIDTPPSTGPITED